MQQKNLVVVRAGENSLHREWMIGKGQRNWDLFVSWYGQDPYEPYENERVQHVKGGKWDGLFKTFLTNPDLLNQYDYIWLPDDDIRTDTDTINALFDLIQKFELRVAQPSLTWDSYFSHFVTLNVPGLTLRYTNFVEVMVPCFEKSLLRDMLPFFEHTMTGYGLDWIWPLWDQDPKYKAAIIDCITVKHTRPLGRFLSPMAKSKGSRPVDELEQILKHYHLPNAKRIFGYSYAAIGKNNIINYRSRYATLLTVIHRMLPFSLTIVESQKRRDYGIKYLRRYIKNNLFFMKNMAIDSLRNKHAA